MDIFDWSPKQTIDVVDELKKLLLEEARQLDYWADEAECGGWSTLHVEPMRKHAQQIRARLVTLGVVR